MTTPKFELRECEPALSDFMKKRFPNNKNKITFYFNQPNGVIRFHEYKDTRGRLPNNDNTEEHKKAIARKASLKYYYKVVKPKREELKNK